MSEAAEKGTSNTDISGLIANLLSNPEAISKMGDIISRIGGKENGDSSPHSSENIVLDEADNTSSKNNNENIDTSSPTFQNSEMDGILSKLPEMLSKISSSKAENSIATKQQIALLLAIRPYLSEHRRDLIDTFVKMNRLGAIFKNLT